MATMNNPAVTPEWLEKAARTEAPATADRVPLVQPTRTPTPPIDLKPASRLPAETSVEAEKPTNEADVHVRGYDAAALLPSTIVLGLITVAVVMFIRPFVPERYIAEFTTLPLLGLWAGQMVRGGYRLFKFRYRLTTQNLYRERGRLYPNDEPLDLTTVSKVEVRRTRVQFLMGVGDVIVHSEESLKRLPLDMSGVRWPKTFAALIESTVAAAREQTVIAAKAAFATLQARSALPSVKR
jgi:hypothetical protein